MKITLAVCTVQRGAASPGPVPRALVIVFISFEARRGAGDRLRTAELKPHDWSSLNDGLVINI